MTEEWLIKFFLLTYTGSALVSYVPQNVKMVKTKHAEDLSLESWALWVFGSCAYFGYVCLSTPEPGLIFMAFLDLACCLTICLLTFYYQCMEAEGKRIQEEYERDLAAGKVPEVPEALDQKCRNLISAHFRKNK